MKNMSLMISVLAVLVVVLVLVLKKDFVQKAVQFLREAIIELRKVSWAGKKEVFGTTIVVVVLVFFVGLYIGLVDFVLSRFLGLILK